MFISKYPANGSFSPKYIKENFCRNAEHVLFTRIGNQHIAVILDGSFVDGDLPAPIIIMDVEKDIPLWKQGMNMQMGKPYRTKQSERTTRQVRWLNDSEIHGNMRFEVYKCMYL